MNFVDINVRIHEGDVIVRDGNAVKVMSIGDDEVQLAAPGDFTDRITETDKLDRHLAGAETIAIFRQ